MADDINDVSHTSTLAKNNEAVRREALGDGVAQQTSIAAKPWTGNLSVDLRRGSLSVRADGLAVIDGAGVCWAIVFPDKGGFYDHASTIVDAVNDLSSPRSGQKSAAMLSELDDASNACLELAAKHGYATGHGDTVADMIREFSAQIPSPRSPGGTAEKKVWDEGEHEGCGADSERAYKAWLAASAQHPTGNDCDCPAIEGQLNASEAEVSRLRAQVETMDTMLAEAADTLNSTPIMHAMDVGNKITQWRLARQKSAALPSTNCGCPKCGKPFPCACVSFAPQEREVAP